MTSGKRRRNARTTGGTTDDVRIAELVSGVREGRYDAAFTCPPTVAGLASTTLLTERACAVLPDGHPLAGRAELHLSELAGDPWVLTPRSSWPPWHAKYDQDYQRAGFEPNVVRRASSVQNLLGLVAAGVGVTRLARSASTLRPAGVTFVSLIDDWANTDLVWRPDADRPALYRLIDVVSELANTAELAQAG